MTDFNIPADDYDSPWKIAIDGYLPDFMAFYFPQIHADIDWSQGYESLDNEFQAIIRDADLGKHRADKLIKVMTLEGTPKMVYIHIEVQSQVDSSFEQRMFTYNYRIFDKFGQFAVSLAVLADEHEHWQPNAFHFEQWGFSSHTQFPIVKLLAYEDLLDELQASDNAFAILTAAHILTKRTKKQPQERLLKKIILVRLLYQNGWHKQRILDFFMIIDWLMHLPTEFTVQFKTELHRLEEEDKMRYVTSIERLAMAEGIQQGIQQGKSWTLRQVLALRFPNADLTRYQSAIDQAAEDQLVNYIIKASTVATLDEVFMA